MLTINLLPAEEKKAVRLEELRRIIRFFSGGLAVVFMIAAILLLPSFLPIYFQEKELERALELEEEAGAALKVKGSLSNMHQVETIIAAVRKFSSAPSSAHELLEGLLGAAGNGIAVSTLTIKKGGEVVFAGRAGTRDDLLNFEKNLRDSGKFQNISSPLSNIIRETNINFTIQGKLKPFYGL